jgi:hypothetical protein
LPMPEGAWGSNNGGAGSEEVVVLAVGTTEGRIGSEEAAAMVGVVDFLRRALRRLYGRSLGSYLHPSAWQRSLANNLDFDWLLEEPWRKKGNTVCCVSLQMQVLKMQSQTVRNLGILANG